MPTPNARKHQVPTNTEQPSRAGWVLNPLLSVNDIVPVASTSDRATVTANIGYTPSVNRPLVVFRADAAPGREFEYTVNGSTWRTIPADDDSGWVSLSAPSGYTGQMRYRRKSGWGAATIVLSSTTAAGTNVSPTFIALPAGYRPSVDDFGDAKVRAGSPPTTSGFLLQVAPSGAVSVPNLTIAAGNSIVGSVKWPIDS